MKTSTFEKMIFAIVRIFVCILIFASIAGMVLLTTNIKNQKPESTIVELTELLPETTPQNTQETSINFIDKYQMIKKQFIHYEHQEILQKWIRDLSSIQQEEFLMNLNNILQQAETQKLSQDEIIDIINNYKTTKFKKFESVNNINYMDEAKKILQYASILSLFVVMCILGMVLVLLAIERNTRKEIDIKQMSNIEKTYSVPQS
ncbi:MAG: hypothetical protein WC188_03270 [Candidatus Caldatribacteriota bacterium]|jgi:hypothetical protein|nr:hypothetical protein [Patescibacteria group bacterium]